MRLAPILVFSALFALAPGTALAHGDAIAPHDLPSAWNLDPFVLAPALLVGWLYARGARRLWRNAGAGRGVARWQVAAFGAGLLIAVLAVVSPLDAAADTLFTAHMVQHLALMIIAAPLIVTGLPGVAMTWGLPPQWRRRFHDLQQTRLRAAWHQLTHPLIALALYTATFWLWHLPAFYERALANDGVHALEHASFLGAALLFWWSMMRRRSDFPAGPGVFVMFFAMGQSALLSLIFIFGNHLWYGAYAGSVDAWNLTPERDQQLAGLVMWPSMWVYFAGAAAIIVRWFRDEERRARVEDRRVRAEAAGRARPPLAP